MSPATWPRASKLDERLLVVDPSAGEGARGRFVEARVRDLASYVGAGDVVVVNDAATLPASLRGVTARGEPVEARLIPPAASANEAWRAVIFGAGDWRTRTEDRPPPPRLAPGDALAFGPDLVARVTLVDAASPQLVELRWELGDDARVWRAVHRVGRPVQYAHLAGPLAPWHVQTAFASRPWASEMPSAARPLAWETLLALRAKGVTLARVTHAAGLSSTGDAALDARLPLRESFEVPRETARAIRDARTRARGARVLAIGTSVVRALESAADGSPGGALEPARGETELRVDGRRALRACDAILTGMHEPGTSHDDLLHAFAPAPLLDRARAFAEARGFLGHELGDSMLVLPGALSSAATP